MPQCRIDDIVAVDAVLEVLLVDGIDGFVTSRPDGSFSLFSLLFDLIGIDILPGLGNDCVLDGHCGLLCGICIVFTHVTDV